MATFSWLNIFGVLRESEKSPYSRTLRTGFTGKISDAFSVFAGHINLYEDCNYLGVFDYFTLSFFFFIQRAMQWIPKHYETDDPTYWGLMVPTFLISLAASVVRIAFASVLTIVFSPFIFIAHLYIDFSTQWHANKEKSTVLNIEGEDHSYKTPIAKKSLGKFLQAHRIGIEDLSIKRYETSTGEKFVESAKTVTHATQTIVNGGRSLLSYIPGLGGVAPPPKRRYRKKQEVVRTPDATLSFFYKHPEKTECMPTWRPSWGSLFCYAWFFTNTAAYQAGKYGFQQAEEGIRGFVDGDKVDEFRINIYNDDKEQAHELDALFMLNIGNALNNTKLDIRRDTKRKPVLSEDTIQEDEDNREEDIPSLLRLHLSP